MTNQEETMQPLSITSDEVANLLNQLEDKDLMQLSFPLYSNAYGSGSDVKDADGFPLITEGGMHDMSELRKECWNKAESNPQLNSHIRDFMGRMTGWGFSFSSERQLVHKAVEEISEDPRNDLYQNFPKYVARAEIEGELFLMYTLHRDGFVEVDFITPDMIGGGGDNGSGIIHHSTKQTFPLFFHVRFKDTRDQISDEHEALIPSINLCYFPELEKDARTHPDFDEKKLRLSKTRKANTKPYNQLNGYFRFIVHWNKGFLTQRNVSHIRTTIEWVNYYEALKKYEIDHKKSSGAYLWVIEMEDVQAFRRWLGMSEEERKKTGIMQTKDPGGTIVLPPGLKLRVENPKLPNISDQDTDIMQMVTSGLQKPQDVVLGDYRSTYASVKASQGPQGDRINDELHYFRTFLTYHFWRPILYLRSIALEEFKFHRYIKKVTGFENGKPINGRVKVPVYKFVDVSLPTSRLEDVEALAKAFLGSKHASLVDTLGIPRRELAKRLGFSNYPQLRKEKAQEDEEFPKTLSVQNQEGAQEKQESEPSKEKKKEENDE